MKIIYNQGYTNDLAVQDDVQDGYYGWLFYRHPGGQWVSLVDIKKECEFLPANGQKQSALEPSQEIQKLYAEAVEWFRYRATQNLFA
jgi:hypothetical protein